MQPFFSVVIPTLNESNTIGNVLIDLSDQSFNNFEVIIVDGKSEDDTVKTVEQNRNGLNLQIVTSPKRNLCFQKNLGAEQASGKYLVFFDADIRIDPSYFEEVYTAITKENSAFLTTYQLPDENNSLDTFLVEVANVTLEMLLTINKQMAPGYNLIVQRDIFEDLGGFDEAAVFSEDHELSIRIWEKKKKRLKIIKKHLLRWSFRRLRKDGRMSVIYKYSLATLHMLLLGKITDANFRYPMGGDYFATIDTLKQRKYLDKFKTEIKKLINIESTLP